MFIHRIFSSADQRVPEGPIGCNTRTRARTRQTNLLTHHCAGISFSLLHLTLKPHQRYYNCQYRVINIQIRAAIYIFALICISERRPFRSCTCSHEVSRGRARASKANVQEGFFWGDEGFTQSRYVDCEIEAEIYEEKNRVESVNCDPQQRDGQTDRRGFGNERIWREKRKNNNSLSLPHSLSLPASLSLLSRSLPLPISLSVFVSLSLSDICPPNGIGSTEQRNQTWAWRREGGGVAGQTG